MIVFKESTTVQGGPKLKYLGGLLHGKGYRTVEVTKVQGPAPFFGLCVSKPGVQVSPHEILEVLRQDQEIDLTALDAKAEKPNKNN